MAHKIPQVLISKIQNNEVIPFVGAGISSGVRYTDGNRVFLTWKELLLSAAQMLNEKGDEQTAQLIPLLIDEAGSSEDYFDIASQIKKRLSSQWQEFLKSNFKKTFDDRIDKKTLEIPQEIWNLGRLVITTNYDDVLRWSNDNKDDLTFWDIRSIAGQVNSLKTYPTQDIIWHLHGKIDNLDDIVLTKESYERVYGESSDVKDAIDVLKTHMTTKCFLFLGFSLDDAYLREQLKQVHGLFGGHTGPHYILIKKEDEPDLDGLGDIRPIYIEDYESDYLTALKELTKYRVETERESSLK